jgi:hypothetical protein
VGLAGPRLRAHRRRGPARHHVLRRPDLRGGLRVASDQGQARASRAGHCGAVRSTGCACRTRTVSASSTAAFG